MSRRKGAWKLWSLALGEKASKHDHEADRVALIRTLIFASYLITNSVIISGVVRHWDDGLRHHEGALSCLKATKKGA